MESNWNNYYFLNFIISQPDKPWDWRYLSSNPNITMDIVMANPDKPWNWYRLSIYSNLSMDFVMANPSKPWDWLYLSLNHFIKAREMFELRVKHQKFVQDYLFEEFVKISMHPKRINKLLEMGYSIFELDEVL